MSSNMSTNKIIIAILIICMSATFIIIYTNNSYPSTIHVLLENTSNVQTTNDYLFIIIMSSYPRKNNRSPYFVKRAVRAVLAQSYTNWQLFVTGDHYENESEFRALFQPIPSSKLFFYNLPKPGERDNLTGIELWQSGGVMAMNNAIDRAENYHKNHALTTNIYFTNLDDDDTWSSEHLREHLSIYIRFPTVAFIWSKGYYCPSGGNPYPVARVDPDRVNNWAHGFGGSILHSAWSWSMKVFKGFRYRGHWDFPANFQGPKTSDYDLFEVIREYMAAKKLHFYHSNRATIEHLSEMGTACKKNGPLWYPDN